MWIAILVGIYKIHHLELQFTKQNFIGCYYNLSKLINNLQDNEEER